MFHVDDVKARYRRKNVVDNLEQWIEFIFGDPKIEHFNSVRGMGTPECFQIRDLNTRAFLNKK